MTREMVRMIGNETISTYDSQQKDAGSLIPS